MCLVLIAWRVHPNYRCLVAANRDELHTRPAAAAAWWPDRPKILAGRDLEAGGTWLGIMNCVVPKVSGRRIRSSSL